MTRDCYREDDDNRYDFVEDNTDLDDLEVADVPWKEDIEKIPDLDLKLKEIQEAEKFKAEKKALDDRLENGEISLGAYDSILRPKIRKATTRCGFASVGLTYDDFGDVSEDYDLLTTGSLVLTKLKDQIKETIEDLGPDAAKDLADQMLAEERLEKDTHDLISRQIRINKRRNKE